TYRVESSASPRLPETHLSGRHHDKASTSQHSQLSIACFRWTPHDHVSVWTFRARGRKIPHTNLIMAKTAPTPPCTILSTEGRVSAFGLRDAAAPARDQKRERTQGDEDNPDHHDAAHLRTGGRQAAGATVDADLDRARLAVDALRSAGSPLVDREHGAGRGRHGSRRGPASGGQARQGRTAVVLQRSEPGVADAVLVAGAGEGAGAVAAHVVPRGGGRTGDLAVGTGAGTCRHDRAERTQPLARR